MHRLTAAERRSALRENLTGPWDVTRLTRDCGLEYKALQPQWQVARERLRDVLSDVPRDRGWPGVRFDPDAFLTLLRETHDAQADRDALYTERYGAADLSKGRPNMGVLRWAIREHERMSLHLRLHWMLWWNGVLRWNDLPDDERRATNRRVCTELLKVCDRIDPVQRKAYDAALRIGGRSALDSVVFELSDGVFVPAHAEDG